MGLFDRFEKSKSILRYFTHRHFYLLGLAVMLCGLTWSNFLMSLGQFILLGNWILEFDFLNKWKSFKSNTLLFPVVGLFILHALGLIWTTDFDYGMKDITTKLPLLSIPIIIATTRKLKLNEWKGLLNIYWSSTIIISLISLLKFLEIGFEPVTDKRELAIYISHIRYGLNIALLVVLLFYFRPIYRNKAIIVLLYLSIIWLCIALSLFELVTGLVCLLLAGLLRLIVFVFRKKNSTFSKISFIGILIVVSIFSNHQIQNIYRDYSTPVELSFDQYKLTDTTKNGNPYIHNFNSKKENGVLISHFFAYKELRDEWEKVSAMNYKGKDHKGNPLFYTLLRYMSSKGLKKDSLGFSTLSKREIKAIENGIANVYYLNHNPIQNRIHQTFYEFDQWRNYGSINGYSLVMRFEYWKTAWNLIKKNYWIGVGTGDVKKEMTAQYVIDNSALDEKYRKRAHNQYLTFWLALGIGGLIVFVFMLFYPFFQVKDSLLYGIFTLILAISCLMEDTFETQAGITFSVLFYALILFGVNQEKELPYNT